MPASTRSSAGPAAVRALAATLAMLALGPLDACGGGETQGGSTTNGQIGPGTTEAAMILEGTIRLDGATGSTMVATLRIMLRDVSRTDASSVVVAETVLRAVTLDSTTALEFSLAVPANLDPGSSYELAAHADVDDSGDITVGDFLTMTSQPVDVSGTQPPLELVARRVQS